MIYFKPDEWLFVPQNLDCPHLYSSSQRTRGHNIRTHISEPLFDCRPTWTPVRWSVLFNNYLIIANILINFMLGENNEIIFLIKSNCIGVLLYRRSITNTSVKTKKNTLRSIQKDISLYWPIDIDLHWKVLILKLSFLLAIFVRPHKTCAYQMLEWPVMKTCCNWFVMLFWKHEMHDLYDTCAKLLSKTYKNHICMFEIRLILSFVEEDDDFQIDKINIS